MTPIKEFLNRIKWDRKEKKGDYEVVYNDRVFGKEIRVKYDEIIWYDNEFFKIKDSEIPLHRIKKVYKNGKLVWGRG